MTSTVYVYKITGAKVVDGDTYDLTVEKDLDPGFYYHQVFSWTSRFRLNGFDCPETIRAKTDRERAKGLEAKAYAAEFLTRPNLQAETAKDPDDFGRWLVIITDLDTNEDLGLSLRLQKLASIWPTRWREEFDL